MIGSQIVVCLLLSALIGFAAKKKLAKYDVDEDACADVDEDDDDDEDGEHKEIELAGR
jgi:hypothetical protein